MARKKNKDMKTVGLLAAVILLLVAARFLTGSFSVLSTQNIGAEYSYVYAPFNEDYVLFITSYTTNESDGDATWLFRHDTDRAYPQNISITQAGTGGLWIDSVNEQVYYDIQKETRSFFIYGTCYAVNPNYAGGTTGKIDATEITATDIGGIKGVKCTFPSMPVGTYTYAADLRIEFKEPCAEDTFKPETCDKAWYVTPFLTGKHVTGWDFNHCATHRCDTDIQWLNIIIALLSIAALIILVKRRMLMK